MNTPTFDIRAEGDITPWLRLIMGGGEARSWRAVPEKKTRNESGVFVTVELPAVLYVGWAVPDVAQPAFTPLPCPWPSDLVGPAVEVWLAHQFRHSGIGAKPRGDGSSTPGWRLWSPPPSDDRYAIFAVSPAWIYHGK